MNTLALAATLLASASGAAAPAAGARTLAERLGHPRDARLLIVHADDLGEWHAVNAASIRAFEKGVISSAVMMPACPWFPEIAAWARQHPELDMGLHLTMTSERTDYRWGPAASRDRIPSLLDSFGYLREDQVEAIQVIDAREAEAELRAQVERALAFGLRPTHLDSHQGLLYQRKDLFEALVRVSRAYRIPIGLARSQIEDHPFMADAVSPEDPLIDRTFDISPDVPPERWGDWYEEQFRGIGPGVTAVLVHLGLADAELRAATADRPTWGAEWRQRDFDFVMSDRFRRILEEGGFILTTWRAIGALPPPPASGEAAR